MRGESAAPPPSPLSTSAAAIIAAASPAGGAPPPSTRSPPPAPVFLRGADAIVWARNFSAEDAERCECDTLQRVLTVSSGASPPALV